jgi:hypothetical protein
MPKRSRKKTPKVRRPRKDPNVAAFDVLKQVMEKAEAEGKDPLAVALGQRGGLKGGRARADMLTAEQRRESARNAANARWAKAAK